LVANSRQSTSQLAGSALNHAHQLCNGFVTGRQRSQHINLVRCEELALKRSCLALELVLTLGKLFEDTGSSARMLFVEGNQGRAGELIVENTVRGVTDSALEQGVTYDTYVHASFTRLFTESGHSTHCHATGISHDCGKGAFGSLVDFSDDGLLVFESNCHGIQLLDITVSPDRSRACLGV